MLDVFIPVFGNDFSFLASTFAGSLTSGAFCPKSTPGVEGWAVPSLVKSKAGTSLIAGVTAFTPPLNSGSSGCTRASPLEASGLVGFGASPSGLPGTVGASSSLTPPLNSGFSSATGASAAFTPPVYSGASATVGGVASLAPPLKSDPLSPEGESLGLTPPLNSGALGEVGTSSGCLASSEGASLGFTPPAKSLGSSPLGTSFKFSI